MKDINKFIKLYKSLGIDLIVNRTDEGQYIILGESFYNHKEVTFSKYFKGYIGYHTVISFDIKGNFLSQGFYE